MSTASSEPIAVFGDRVLSELREVSDDPEVLETGGTWAAVLPFDGPPTFARFDRCEPTSGGSPSTHSARWVGVAADSWCSSLDEMAFRRGVTAVVDAIDAGELQQVNLTRVLEAPLPPGADIISLGAALAAGNPSPYPASIRLPDQGIHIASASPELFLERDGNRIRSTPIKGTARTAGELLPKDHHENVLVTELVVTEFAEVCRPGSITMSDGPRTEAHPGLVHLVSTVEGQLDGDIGWAGLLTANLPPASVAGVPRSAAGSLIDRLEPVDRGPYCGAVGWIDADDDRAVLGVAVRTFWFADGRIRFGTGSGIVGASDPRGEWEETQLKAQRLLSIAEAPRGPA